MLMKGKRCNELTIERKENVLDLLDKGISQRKDAAEFGIAKTTAIII